MAAVSKSINFTWRLKVVPAPNNLFPAYALSPGMLQEMTNGQSQIIVAFFCLYIYIQVMSISIHSICKGREATQNFVFIDESPKFHIVI